MIVIAPLTAVLEIKRRECFRAADILGGKDLAVFHELPVQGVLLEQDPDRIPLARIKVKVDIPGKNVGNNLTWRITLFYRFLSMKERNDSISHYWRMEKNMLTQLSGNRSHYFLI